MSKTQVFIYGSCVSRDTFEHLDPHQFELVQYVARQSAISAYTRPVTLIDPPAMPSRFQQRMISGDFSSSMQELVPQASSETDIILVDLTDERLGAYVLPDGSVVTRSLELIQSGGESSLPSASQLLKFGTDQHFEYWSRGISAVAELFRTHMPDATTVLLDIPWAEWSDSGSPTPSSFGITAQDANPLLEAYATFAADRLRAHRVSLPASEVASSTAHPWGDAPFHYADSVYVEIVRRLTGTEGREVWAHTSPAPTTTPRTQVNEPRPKDDAHKPARHDSYPWPNLLLAGTQKAGVTWLGRELGKHPDIYIAPGGELNYFSSSAALASAEDTQKYVSEFEPAGNSRWRGEHTAHYFWHANGSPFSPDRPDVAAEIRSRTPDDAHVIISLRDPVSRAVAAYWHHFAAGRFNLSTSMFHVPSGMGVVDLGFYRRHYEHWVDVFGRSNVTVLLYDDLVVDPKSYLKDALDALQLDASEQYWSEVRGTGREDKAPSWTGAFKQLHPIKPQEIAALLSLYSDDIRFVEELLGRDLSSWRDIGELIRIHT